MPSLENQKMIWAGVKTVGTILANAASVPIALISGGIGIAMGLTKTAVVVAALGGGAGAVFLGVGMLVAGTLCETKVIEKISNAKIAAMGFKKTSPAVGAPAPEVTAPAPDLSKEFNTGVDVETMKPLRLKAQPDPDNGSGMKVLRFKSKADSTRTPTG